MIRLGEILAVPGLGLTLRVSPVRGDPWMRWARVLEDPQDIESLGEGELVLTAARWRQSPLDTDRFVCALARRRTAALGLRSASDDTVAEVASACDRWRLPLLAVSDMTSADEVVQTAVTMIVERESSGLARSSHLSRALACALRERRPLAAIVIALGHELGRAVWLLSRTGAVGEFTPSDVDLQAAAEAVGGRAATVALELSDGPATAFAVTLSADYGRPTPHLICAGDEAELSGDDRLAIDQALAFLSTEVEFNERLRAVRAAAGTEFIRRARSGEADPVELDAWTRALGVDPRGHVICLVVHAERASGRDLSDLVSSLEDLADAYDLPRIAVVDDREASMFLFVGELDERIVHAVGRAKLALGPTLARVDGVLGTSSVIARDVADVMRLLHDARRVCQLNQLRARTPEPPRARPAAPLSALLLNENADARTALYQTVLEPLIVYDEQHDSELVRTLDVFLSSNGQWSVSAAELGVHVNTLRYRLARIVKCTGRDLNSMADRVDFYLALQARDAERTGQRRLTPAHG